MTFPTAANKPGQTAEQLEALIEALPNAIFFKDGMGRWQVVNSTGLRLFHLTGNDWQGKSDLELAALYPQFRDAYEQCYRDDQTAWESGNRYDTIEYVPDESGALHVFEVTKVPLFKPDGERRGLVIIGRDVTDQRHTQEKLKQLLLEQQTILNNAVVGMAYVRARHGVWINAKMEEMFGYSREAVDGLSTECFYPSRESYEKVGEEAYAALGRGEVYVSERRMRRKDGSLFWCLMSGKLVDMNDPGKGSIWILQDITGRRRAEEALNRLNKTLAHQVRDEVAKNREKDHLLIRQSRLAAMGEMIGNIAHQWRQPINALTILLSNIQDAYQHGELDDAYLNDAISLGQQLIQRMSGTIDDFRNFFKPNREKVIFNVTDAIRNALSLTEAAFKNHHIALTLEADQNVPVAGFPNEYAQVILNILENAKDAILATAAPHGRITITARPDGDAARVAIRDNGGGIAAEILGKIFDPYFTTRGKGTGIGLYMSKMIVENNMNGQIEAYNEKEGAEFIVTVPIAKTAAS